MPRKPLDAGAGQVCNMLRNSLQYVAGPVATVGLPYGEREPMLRAQGPRGPVAPPEPVEPAASPPAHAEPGDPLPEWLTGGRGVGSFRPFSAEDRLLPQVRGRSGSSIRAAAR